jgi:hypothetical protein
LSVILIDITALFSNGLRRAAKYIKFSLNFLRALADKRYIINVRDGNIRKDGAV